MKRLGGFDLRLERSFRSPRKSIPVEVLVDSENTVIVLDCSCCEDLLASRLPGGVLIPIASSLKSYFGTRGMRNIDVRVNGAIMSRTYKGICMEDAVPEIKDVLEGAVARFHKKRKNR
ncbi:MAG: hypothetical protein AM324_013390 [Candidatus Thorarchaeota archaeon SMTZ1-83]|nr:MAG: hypothetical protein AM324_14530 [Candidatus Thorarchaeota archaeon SMTZ1-83]